MLRQPSGFRDLLQRLVLDDTFNDCVSTLLGEFRVEMLTWMLGFRVTKIIGCLQYLLLDVFRHIGCTGKNSLSVLAVYPSSITHIPEAWPLLWFLTRHKAQS